MQRKGQAAMEFLMTYGWAILAAIIAIGVLAAFGVFSPNRLVGPAAAMNPPFSVDDFNIIDGVASADTINLNVIQNAGESIIPGTYTITLPDGTSCTGSGIAATWISGNVENAVFTCPIGTWAAGDAVSGDISIAYTIGAGGLAQQATGSVRGVAQ